ncbi:unnamed protein product [Spirodela intermedia]|uniref:Uncharacterized protein n=1 Tax=Spirodela intermedia TaxID=51605 RepID=A0A7I8KFD5_SPIIN|nr:unnamed protein product [Spirodela intermedia]
MACSSSLPWHHLQHTIGGISNDHGSSPLAQQEGDQSKMPLHEATVLSPHLSKNNEKI